MAHQDTDVLLTPRPTFSTPDQVYESKQGVRAVRPTSGEYRVPVTTFDPVVSITPSTPRMGTTTPPDFISGRAPKKSASGAASLIEGDPKILEF